MSIPGVHIGPGVFWLTSVLPEDYLPGGKYWDEDVRGVHVCMRGTADAPPRVQELADIAIAAGRSALSESVRLGLRSRLYLWALYTQLQVETMPADLSSLPRNGHLLEVV